MSTKALLYPFGFYFTDNIPLPDDDHPVVTSLDQAMDNYWRYCTLSAVVTVRVNDFPAIGTHVDIAATMPGSRLDFNGSVIANTDPRSLIGASKDYRSANEFAAPSDFPSLFKAGQAFGFDNTYIGRYAFRGLMAFTKLHALPEITGGFLITCDNGATFEFSVQQPINPNRVTTSMTIAGLVVPIWLSWNGAAVPATAPPSGNVVVSVSQNFIWP